MAAHDIDLNQWVDSTIVGVLASSVNQGTVYITDASGVHHFGYDLQTKKWSLGEFTVAYCKNLSWEPSLTKTMALVDFPRPSKVIKGDNSDHPFYWLRLRFDTMSEYISALDKLQSPQDK